MIASRQRTKDRIRNGVTTLHIVAELINDHDAQLKTDEEVNQEQDNVSAVKVLAALMDNAHGINDAEISDMEDVVEKEMYIHHMSAT